MKKSDSPIYLKLEKNIELAKEFSLKVFVGYLNNSLSFSCCAKNIDNAIKQLEFAFPDCSLSFELKEYKS